MASSAKKPVAKAAAPRKTAVPAVKVIQDVSEGATAPKVETAAAASASTKTAEGKFAMTDVIETGKKFAADAKAKVESVVVELNEKAKATADKSVKLFSEMGDITKGNVEALVESSQIAVKGVEALGKEAADFSRKQIEKSSASMKALASIKSPNELFQFQSALLTSAFDAFAAETSKNSQTMLKLAGDIAQPISTRVSVVTDKVKALAA